MAKQTTAEFIATLRKANGYTQQEVAEKLNISDRTLSSWETGRTAPDLLLLPALADLYGVTVDEILRGERRQYDKPAEPELSDKAQKDLRKRRYAGFCGKRILLFGLGLLSALIFLVGCVCLLYSSSPLWLNILLMVLGAGGNIACLTLLLCFEYSALKNEGIVLEEDYTEANKPYALTLKHKTANTLIFNSLPYIAGAIIFLIVFFACGFNNYHITVGELKVKLDYTTPTAVLVSLNALFGLALLISGLAINGVKLTKLGNDEQLSARRYNAKLFGKAYGFSAIPVAVGLILFLIFEFAPITHDHVIYRSKDLQAFKDHMQTLVIPEEATKPQGFTQPIALPAGEYVLHFPENYEQGIEYDLGNGITGEYRSSYVHENQYGWNSDYFLEEWTITPPYRDDEVEGDCIGFMVWSGIVMRIPVAGSDECADIVNVRYKTYADEYYRPDYTEDSTVFSRFEMWLYDNEYYEYAEVLVYQLGPHFGGADILITAAALVTATTLYCVKKKKIKFGF